MLLLIFKYYTTNTPPPACYTINIIVPCIIQQTSVYILQRKNVIFEETNAFEYIRLDSSVFQWAQIFSSMDVIKYVPKIETCESL